MPSISSTHQCSGKMSGGMEIESGGAGHVSRSAGRADVETTTTKGLTGFMPNRKVGRPGLCLRDTSRSPLFLAKHGATAASASRERRAVGGRTAGEKWTCVLRTTGSCSGFESGTPINLARSYLEYSSDRVRRFRTQKVLREGVEVLGEVSGEVSKIQRL